MIFGSVPDGRTTIRTQVLVVAAEEDKRIGSPPAPLPQQIGDRDLDAGQPTGRGRAQSRHHRGGLGGVGDASRHRGRGVHAMAHGEVVERVEHRAPLIPQRGNQIAGQHGRADAVLVADGARIDAVPDRLFVRVDEVQPGRSTSARDSHLNPVSVSTCRAPWSAAMAASMRDDTTVLATTVAPQTGPGSICERR